MLIGFHLRHLVDGERDHVRDQPHRGLGRERVGAAREELLDDVVLRGALEGVAVDAVLLRHGHVEREQPGRGGVDRHRRVHRVQRDAVEQGVHVALVRDRDADLAHLAARELVVRVVAGLRGQVEGHGQAGLALREVPAVELVRLARRRMAGVGAHHPRPVGLRKSVSRPAHTGIVRSRAREQADRRDAPGAGPGDLRLRAGRRDRGPGPLHRRGDAPRGARSRGAAGAPAHPHPPRSRRRLGRALPALPGARGVRARARRAAPDRPLQAPEERRAPVRGRHGAPLGRGGAGGRGARAHPAGAARSWRASGWRTHPGTPRTTCPTCTRTRATPTWATWPACGSRRTGSRCRPRRRRTSTSSCGSESLRDARGVGPGRRSA